MRSALSHGDIYFLTVSFTGGPGWDVSDIPGLAESGTHRVEAEKHFGMGLALLFVLKSLLFLYKAGAPLSQSLEERKKPTG